MADESVASIIPWHQPEITNARSNRVRVTKLDEPPKWDAKPKPQAKPQAKPKPKARQGARKVKATPAHGEPPASEALIAPDFMEYVESQARRPPLPAASRLQDTAAPPAAAPLPVPAAPAVVAQPAAAAVVSPAPEAVAQDDRIGRPGASSLLLRAAAFALAGVGVTMNGWFAQSLGSTHVAGWMFLAIGVASDLVALVMPTCAARLWHGRHHATALAGWAVWTLTFLFAVTAGIGFASTNISEVALARTSRVTPAIEAARMQLTDAMAARDRECKGGVGKFCREREAAVAERRHAVDTATQQVAQTGDPQTEAAIKLVAWLSHGLLKPEADDFAMLRLVLLALLPQFGGILLMVGRRTEEPAAALR
jgi:hypothetical protein